MKRPLAAACGLVLGAALAACGGPASESACGAGAGRPHPEIGGQILYYCLDQPAVNGGIYLLDVATGRVRALTSDLAYNLDGAWSPDGSTIAFQSSRDGRDDIYTMDANGGGIRRITDGHGFNEYPSWSPDGRSILFNSTRDGVGSSRVTGYYRDLYVMRPDGTGVHRVSAHDASFAFAAWSPDGTSIAFSSDADGTWQVYAMGADGSGVRQLTRSTNTAGSAGFPRWSPDGERLAFSSSWGGEPASIYWVTVGQPAHHRVTSGAHGGRWDGYPDWSPDGKWIVFERNADDSQLYAVHPDGSDLTQLTGGSGSKVLPRWRPE